MEGLTMNAPQWIVLTIFAIAMVVDAFKAYGWRPENEADSDSFYAFRIMFRPLVWVSLLYWGGFFT